MGQVDGEGSFTRTRSEGHRLASVVISAMEVCTCTWLLAEWHNASEKWRSEEECPMPQQVGLQTFISNRGYQILEYPFKWVLLQLFFSFLFSPLCGGDCCYLMYLFEKKKSLFMIMVNFQLWTALYYISIRHNPMIPPIFRSQKAIILRVEMTLRPVIIVWLNVSSSLSLYCCYDTFWAVKVTLPGTSR